MESDLATKLPSESGEVLPQDLEIGPSDSINAPTLKPKKRRIK